MDHTFDTALGDGIRTPMTNLYRAVSATGNPASTGSDVIVAGYTIPAYYFQNTGSTGKGLDVYVQGYIVNNANTKRAKIFIGNTVTTVGTVVSGGTLIADSGAMTVSTGVGFIISASVYKYGAIGSNTQVGLHTASQNGAVVTSLLTTSLLTLNESATINLVVTVNCGTTATDCGVNLFEVDCMNVNTYTAAFA